MILVDDFKNAIDICLHPGKGTGKKMNIGEALGFYYKVSVIPAIIFVILGIVAASVVSSAVGTIIPGSPSIASGAGAGFGAAILIILGLVFLWLAIPLGLFVDAAILHFFGKILLKKFKGTYSDTFAGFVYGELPTVTLFWVALLLFAASSIAGVVVLLVIGLWSFVVSIIAIANLNKTSRLAVIGTIVVEAVIIVVIELIFGILFAGLTLL